MTPAAIQARVYAGLIAGTSQADCVNIARDFVTKTRPRLESTGWELCYHAGSARPPQGAILIGAITCQVEGECDVNMYVYPVHPNAMILRDRCGTKLVEGTERTSLPNDASPTPRWADPKGWYRLENRYQDTGWETMDRESYSTPDAAVDRAAKLSKNIAYGMVRVVDTGTYNNSGVIKTFRAGGDEAA